MNQFKGKFSRKNEPVFLVHNTWRDWLSLLWSNIDFELVLDDKAGSRMLDYSRKMLTQSS